MSDAYPQIPDELKDLPQWVMWKLEERDGKPTKIPYNARYPTQKAASDRPETWSDFKQAVLTLESEPELKLSGIGFMFAPPYIGVDLDHCRNLETGEIDPEAQEEITLLSSYAELSPSGTGLHVLVRGTIPEKGKKKGDREVYTKGRYFTVTGKHLEGTPLTINESQAAIDALWKKWFPEPSPTAPQPVPRLAHVSDDEVLSRCLKNGKFKALFEGNTSGYSSQSEADLALCSLLAMATRDASQIDRLVRQSELRREKWDREDYAARTIAKALSGQPPWKRRICLTHRPLPDMSRDGIDALQDANEPPRLFIRGGEMVFPDRDEKGIPFIRALTEHGLKGELARGAEWYHLTKDKDKEGGYKEVTANPTLEIARDILCRPTHEWGLYPLASITQTPIIDLESGKFRDTEGYDLRTCTYYLPSPVFTIPEIPEYPTEEDITQGKDTIEDIFRDFPFVDDRAKHNAYAGLITAILRPVIPGPVPLFLVDKPQAGCGASLMQKCIYSLATGEEPEEGGAPEKEEEWNKSILSILAKGRQIYTFDNIDRKVSSEALSRLLTAINYSGRLLGTNRDVTYPNRVFWMANGNNVEIGGDIARRLWVSKIDPQMALPWQRTDFKHPDILAYCKDHRGGIVGAVFTLVRGWISKGSPSPSKIPILGGYEGWHTIVGGIMEQAGYTEFLQNVNEIAIEGDIELKQDEEFLSALLENFGSDPWQVKDIETLMGKEQGAPQAGKILLSDCLPDRLADAWKNSSQDFKKRCGCYLRNKKRKRYPCGLMVTNRTPDLHTKIQRWCVVMWNETPQTPQTAQAHLATSGGCGVCGVSSSQYMMKKIENDDHVRAYVMAAGEPRKPAYTAKPVNTVPIRILQHVGLVTGSDGREYDLKAGDIVTLPEDNARALIDKHAAVELRTWEKPIRIPIEDEEEMG